MGGVLEWWNVWVESIGRESGVGDICMPTAVGDTACWVFGIPVLVGTERHPAKTTGLAEALFRRVYLFLSVQLLQLLGALQGPLFQGARPGGHVRVELHLQHC